MRHIVGEAIAQKQGPFLSLYVDERNVKAIKFYNKWGFEDLRHQNQKFDGIPHKAMVRKLDTK